MGAEKDWQKQLVNAAVMAAARTAIQYITNPNSRDEAVEDVRSRLAEVDYSAVGRAVSIGIDRLADNAKVALNEAIDSIRENAEEAVAAAAERAQDQLGSKRKHGRGRLFFGILLGIGLGFILLNEDRRNQLIDRVTGASGPIDSSQWSTVTSNSRPATAESPVPAPAPVTAPESVSAPEPTKPSPSPASQALDETQSQPTEAVPAAKEESKKSKASGEGKKDETSG
jgi:hypothetical protein